VITGATPPMMPIRLRPSMVVAGPQLESAADTRALEHAVAARPSAWSSPPGAGAGDVHSGALLPPGSPVACQGPHITVQCT